MTPVIAYLKNTIMNTVFKYIQYFLFAILVVFTFAAIGEEGVDAIPLYLLLWAAPLGFSHYVTSLISYFSVLVGNPNSSGIFLLSNLALLILFMATVVDSNELESICYGLGSITAGLLAFYYWILLFTREL